MSQYNNMEYAQTEYQQCNNINYNNDNGYYNGRNDGYNNYNTYGSYDNYDNYNNYNNYYNQGNGSTNNQVSSNQYNNTGTPPVRPRRPVPPINSSGQVTPRPSPQMRPVNSVRNSPSIRPVNSVRSSPSIRPVNGRNNVPVRSTTSATVQSRPPPMQRPINNITNPPRYSPQLRPVNSNSASNLQNIPARPTPPSVQQRSNSSPQLRPRNASVEQSVNSPKLPIRSQSSLTNLHNLQKQQSKMRQQTGHSNLSSSTVLDENVELPVPPRKTRGASISSQGSLPDNHSVIDGSVNNSRTHSISSDQGYYDQAYSQPANTHTPTAAPAPVPPPTPQFNGGNIPKQNGSYYNNQYQQSTRPPPAPVQKQNYNYNYNSNVPINFHPQAMYNGIGNQYRPPPPKPKPNAFGGKLPMTSLGGQPMPYGQSLEMYRQNAKKSNDPHVQLEFAKYLIAMADAALDSDPDQKIAHRNQEILYNEGLKWIKKLANQGGGLGKTPYAEAQFFLAECYGNGSIGLQIDHEKAFSYYLQASKQSHPPSTYRAAVCYEHGAGTKKDHQRAVQFYRKAAALGDVLSMYKLGTILLNGTLNQDKNPREGLTWLKRAAAQADQTCPHALHELGLIYEGKNPETNGLIIPDPNYSQELYLKAAQFGYSPSQYKLGLCYEYGLLNLPIDSRRSIAWYSKAAEQGDPEAELALSGWYLTGADNVLAQSDKEAFLWARKAANKGLAKAEYAVGYYYENGIGVKKDLEEAKRSYLSAASQNNKRALVRLKEMKAGYVNRGPIQNWREQSRGTGAASEDCIIS